MEKASKAAKWSTITEVSTKLITPLIQMILARILNVEAFGIIATISMVISFTDIFTDAGFQKYLIQRNFKDENEKQKFTNVAFWSNLTVSLFLWGLIIIFNEEIATLVGSPGLGIVIAIACVQLPIMSFSSIQMALYRRNLDFKTLFYLRIITSLIPLVVTIPLAYAGLNYWSLIIGTLSSNLLSAIVLTINSMWKPKLFYSFKLLKEMLSFSIWSLLETLSIWLTAWVDILIIGRFLNSYYLGIYTTSLNMVNILMTIVTTSVTTVLFATLSRLQEDHSVFTKVFLNVHKLVSYIIFPIGVGVFLYQDLVTDIMLGEKWEEASRVIGIWALTSVIRISMTSMYSEVYRAKGQPKISLFLQLLDLFIIIPTCLLSVSHGFWAIVYARAIIRLDLIIPGLIVMSKLMNIRAKSLLRNLMKPFICIFIMIVIDIGLKQVSSSVYWQFTSIVICGIIYIFIALIIDKKFIMSYVKKR
ncbi:lipopolysaccharide biosynthesis protein [Priestia endophytica]|uniref:Lipopolysaccharide biosynthesis protein n=1 Tax=Priestia endophytica TaxID=135735 RepID=A0AAX1QE97_9BACI|nr:lipopolysaccharide biosynthesis protein [Priestia endophytica]